MWNDIRPVKMHCRLYSTDKDAAYAHLFMQQALICFWLNLCSKWVNSCKISIRNSRYAALCLKYMLLTTVCSLSLTVISLIKKGISLKISIINNIHSCVVAFLVFRFISLFEHRQRKTITWLFGMSFIVCFNRIATNNKQKHNVNSVRVLELCCVQHILLWLMWWEKWGNRNSYNAVVIDRIKR